LSDRRIYGFRIDIVMCVCKIGTAIYLHPVALIFVNIIVDQIWLKATIFGRLMTPIHHSCPQEEIRTSSHSSWNVAVSH